MSKRCTITKDFVSQITGDKNISFEEIRRRVSEYRKGHIVDYRKVEDEPKEDVKNNMTTKTIVKEKVKTNDKVKIIAKQNTNQSTKQTTNSTSKSITNQSAKPLVKNTTQDKKQINKPISNVKSNNIVKTNTVVKTNTIVKSNTNSKQPIKQAKQPIKQQTKSIVLKEEVKPSVFSTSATIQEKPKIIVGNGIKTNDKIQQKNNDKIQQTNTTNKRLVDYLNKQKEKQQNKANQKDTKNNQDKLSQQSNQQNQPNDKRYYRKTVIKHRDGSYDSYITEITQQEHYRRMFERGY